MDTDTGPVPPDDPAPRFDDQGRRVSRRRVLAGSGLAAATAIAASLSTTRAEAGAAASSDTATATDSTSSVPFLGAHQAGILTRQQDFLAFAAYDLVSPDPVSFADLLHTWTAAAARLVAGRPVGGEAALFAPPPDSGEAAGLGPSRLTLTVGFGPSLFDRLGLGRLRPAALVDLPSFGGDALDPDKSGGDLCIQACADDASVAFHAVRNLTRLGEVAVSLRYLQLGAGRTTRPAPDADTPRNLLGFHDGTDNLDPDDEAAMRRFVWVDRNNDQPWMAGGTYLVARRINIHLEAWDRSTLEEQQETIGRVKSSGAPLGARRESDPVDLQALGANGQPLIPNTAHIRQASPALNNGASLLRRGFSFADGMDPDSGELDAGLFFISFQKDPPGQFVPIQQRLADNDGLSQYLVATGSGVFACPPGMGPGEVWGHGLLHALAT
jgi:deferrochelatase/peroxidase EfeB